MRRTGKQGLHQRVREGEHLKRIRCRSRAKQIELAEDLSFDYTDQTHSDSQALSEPTPGDDPCE